MPSNYPGSLDTFSARTDNVDDVMSTDVNQLQEAVLAVETELGANVAGPSTDLAFRLSLSLFEAGNSYTLTMTTDRTLTDTDAPLQFLDPDGSARTVTLPAISTDNHAYMIVNTGDGGETITVKDAGAATVTSITNNSGGFIASDGNAWRPVSSGTLTAAGVSVDTTDFGYSLSSTNTTVQSALNVLDDAILRTIFTPGAGGNFIYSATDDAPTMLAAPSLVGKNIYSGTGGTGAPAWTGGNLVYIGSATTAATSDQTLTVSSIPATYTDLYVVFRNIRSTRAATQDSILPRVNGDTGNNYNVLQLLNGSASQANTSNLANLLICPAANGTTDVVMSGDMIVRGYASTDAHPTFAGRASFYDTGGDYTQEFFDARWTTLSAITSVSITMNTGNFEGAYAPRITVYGIQRGW